MLEKYHTDYIVPQTITTSTFLGSYLYFNHRKQQAAEILHTISGNLTGVEIKLKGHREGIWNVPTGTTRQKIINILEDLIAESIQSVEKVEKILGKLRTLSSAFKCAAFASTIYIGIDLLFGITKNLLNRVDSNF